MFNLTTPQENIWNLQRYYEGTSIANNCGAIFFEKKCDHKLLNIAINKLIELQEGMRLQFAEADGEAVQYIAEYHTEEFTSESFRNRTEFEAYAQNYAQTPFTLIDSPMYRFAIFDLDDVSGVLLCANHLISDAWAISIIASTVYEWYLALESGNILDAKQYSYLPVVDAEKKYLTSSRYEKDKAFWAEQYPVRPEICGIKPNSAPVAHPTAKRYTTCISENLTNKINRFYSDHGVSQAVIFEAAIIAYLSRINPENKNISIGVPVLNRSGAVEKNTVGMCISTTPLTVPVAGDETAEMLCREIIARQFQLFRHQKFPYSHILHDLHERFEFTGNLYDVIVSFQNAQTGAKAKTQWFSNGYCEVGMEFHIDNRDNSDSYTLNIDYQTELFHQNEEIELFVERVLSIVEQIISDPSVKLDAISVLPEEEKQKVLYDFNKTEVPFGSEKCVHELFVEQAKANPDKTALVFEGQSFTYRQLDEMSNSLAHHLRSKGIAPDSIVPIISKRSWHIIVAMLGVLKAGAAYMPVDPTYPKDRIDYMFETARCSLALTFGYSEKLDIDVISLEAFDFASDITPVSNLNSSEDLCYIIFTSGSTGKPKGVAICHRNVINYSAEHGLNVVGGIIKPGENIVSVTNTTFDIFVTESLLPLLNGICIYFANDEQVFSQKKLAELITSDPIDVIQTTPTKMRSYIMDKQNVAYLKKLKAIVLGGEALPTDLYLELRNYTDAKIFNIYGPAETTVWSTNKCVEDTHITIGRPIANTQVYILDANRKPLPIGVAGELCISGDGVGKGYLNRPELTAERFIPNPFIPGTTMYCTGDLARWRADGEIEYLGRIDTQVKIRGLRIELGEIESVMSQFEGIQLAAVTDKKDETGRQYLVGYYTAETEIDEKELRHHLAAKLPKYMVPNYFVHLDEMPMTASGKTDRKNLPVPEFVEQERIYIAPETPTEQKIAAMWEELLQATQVSKTDDFFDLGGDSLVAIHLLTKLETEFDIAITVKDIMEHSELEQLATFVDNADTNTEKIVPTGAKRYELLPQQMAIYTACSKDGNSLAYNMPTKIKLPDTIDRRKLISCIQKLPEIHPELKTRICIVNGVPTAVLDENAEIIIESDCDETDFVRPFDLATAPLVRVAMTEDSLLFDMHHIIADGESLNIILRDMALLYAGVTPATPAIQYADYAAYFENADFSEHKTFFKEMLKCDFEPMVLPEKKHRDAENGISAFYQIDRQTFENARSLARKQNLTDTMLFLGAFGILLSKYTGRSDVLSSVVLTNRGHREAENVIGMFVNTLPIMLPVQGETAEYLEKVRNLVLNLFKYQEIPFLSVAETVGLQDKNAVNTSFVYQATGEKKLSVGGSDLRTEWVDTGTSKFDLSFELTPNENGCAVRIEYNCGKYEQNLIDRLFDAYVRILEGLDQKSIADISVLSPAEYQKVIFDFNDTAMDYPKEKCVHELFVEQAKVTPDKVALVFEGRSFTYRQLDEMSNSLAHYLRSKGIAPGSIVPIISKRSWHVIVAMLGILKAGGAYMPVDPTYPQDRISYMFETAQCSLALTFGYSEKLDIEAISLEAFDFASNITPVSNLNSSDDLCYIIFTSGSTGMPKGVAIAHSNVHNFCQSNAAEPHEILTSKCRCVISLNTFTFDISTFEVLFTLLHGLSLVLANDKEATNADALAELVLRNEVDVIHCTPTKLAMYLNSAAFQKAAYQLKIAVVGAEVFTTELYDKIREYTNAEIYNGYGPSEATVGVSFEQLLPAKAITIGRPIANTQIYILDTHRKPLPIGVAGELCISGDSVGKGYLNRPELTAERFIPNPFIPGTTMYCTGDLARWRADGEIEYLGRIDTQVKIRGLRIELGEIESVMSQLEGIQLAAVTDKKDETGRQYLVGYYTSESEIDEKELRRHLAAKLPKYMVPNYFVHLDEMPMTASGKTDRKNLPAPEFTAIEREYVAPETEQEQILCAVLEELFQMERIGITDDFFELGGDSLRAIEYVAKAHNEGISFALQNVFDYPTVQKLCVFINSNARIKVTYSEEDFLKYQPLLEKNVIDTDFVSVKKSLGNVFLTGATGFLGSHIIDQFMKEETGKIYCLVRGGQERLKSVLEYYFGNAYTADIGSRIVAVDGDITRNDLADDLPKDVQTVIHTAATVKHYGSYDYFHGVNVQGTKNVIAYAERLGAKLIHISTLSVSGNSLVDAFDMYRAEETMEFDENSLYIGQPLDNVYIHSKFEAELAVLDAALGGLVAKIVRVGNLTNRASDLKFQPNYQSNAFLTRVKAGLELGCIPDYLLPLYSEYSPIDQTAEGIIRIAQYADTQTVFHLNNHKNLYFDRMVEIMQMLGIQMEVVVGSAFREILQGLAKNSNTAYLYEAFQNDMDEAGNLVYDSNIHILNEFTVWFMRQCGFEWAEIDYDYVKGYVDYFRNLGYFEV